MIRTFTSALAALVFSTSAFAKSSFTGMIDSSAKTLYGATAAYTGSCTACHGNSIPSLPNKFGTDFQSKYISLGFSLSLSQAQMDSVIKGMELLDSDSDGANTKAELVAGTNPGDAASKPPPTATCTPAAPSLSLDVPSKTGAPGDNLAFALAIKNNDSAGCANATFKLALTLPTNFTGSLSMQSVVLAPGGSSSVTVSVKSPLGQADGNYNFSVDSSDAAQALHAKNVTGTYVVKATTVCQANAPSVVISPASQSGTAGSSLTYKMSVTNNDSSACNSTSFQVSASASSPLSVTASASSLMVGPGQSGSVNLIVKSDMGAMPGTYAFKGSVADAAVAVHAGSATGQYMISASNSNDVTPPTTPANLRAKVGRRGVALRWEPSTDNVGVEKYLVYVDGAKVAEASGPYSRIRVASGSHEITVKAQDAAGNLSNASNAVKIEIIKKRRDDR